jgi:glycogen debranching enzyme
MAQWSVAHDDRREIYADRAERAQRSFNDRFWYARGGYLYDVVDGENNDPGTPRDDPKCRPNQVFAISLDHPVLRQDRWESVMRVVCDRLVTPVGLRSLAPQDAEFKSRYFGDLRARDASYHQGTVWAWLVGPFIDAWLKVYPDDLRTVEHALEGFAAHLNEGCVGSISEVFDATPPFTPRGCIAQAWSVAEVLRARVRVARLLQKGPAENGIGLATQNTGGHSSWR